MYLLNPSDNFDAECEVYRCISTATRTGEDSGPIALPDAPTSSFQRSRILTAGLKGNEVKVNNLYANKRGIMTVKYVICGTRVLCCVVQHPCTMTCKILQIIAILSNALSYKDKFAQQGSTYSLHPHTKSSS